MDDTKITLSRLTDLAERRDKHCYCVFSKFLTPAEQQLAMRFKNKALWGGFAEADRKVAAFYPGFADEEEIYWEIDMVKITVTDGREYTHRDYLGSLLGLGIKREVLGDILIEKDTAFVFCLSSISEYIIHNLTSVARSGVKAQRLEIDESIIPRKKYEEITGSVQAPRLDSVTAVVTGKSRSVAAAFVTSGNVKVNFAETLSVSYTLKENDILSVRGYGKFIYDGISHVSKKGRNIIKLRKYI